MRDRTRVSRQLMGIPSVDDRLRLAVSRPADAGPPLCREYTSRPSRRKIRSPARGNPSGRVRRSAENDTEVDTKSTRLKEDPTELPRLAGSYLTLSVPSKGPIDQRVWVPRVTQEIQAGIVNTCG
jgi:hypothetical protein